MRKLALNRETLVPLSGRELEAANGGGDDQPGLVKPNSGNPTCMHTVCDNLACIIFGTGTCGPKS